MACKTTSPRIYDNLYKERSESKEEEEEKTGCEEKK
jgi:hypothetical protein